MGHSPQQANFSVSENTLAATSVNCLPLVTLTNHSETTSRIDATTGLTQCRLGPVAQDDFAITSLDTSVTINVLLSNVGSDGDALEVVLLNSPVGATAVVNDDGTVTFTPSEGFLGTSTIHYLIEDSDGNSSEATLTVEVVTQFTFDTFNDVLPEEKATGDDVSQPSCCRHDSLTEKIFTLVAQPIFRGSACPGAVVAGRIYDQSGALVGEASANSDQTGSWELQIDDVRDQEFYRVEFYHVPNGCSTSDVCFSVDPAVDSYQVMKTLTLHELG